MSFYLLTETGDRILTEDGANLLVTELATVVPGPTVDYQGDGKTRRRRKRHKHDTEILLADMERTLSELVNGPLAVPASGTVQQEPIAALWSDLDDIRAAAAEYADLSGQLRTLEAALHAYEARQWQAFLDDDDETLLMM